MQISEIKSADYQGIVSQFPEFPSKTLFHESAWLEYLEKTDKGQCKILQFSDPSKGIVGYHVFLEVLVGPFKIMGSPLPGWTTNYMGPLIKSVKDLPALINALKRYIRKKGYLYAEIKNPELTPHIMGGTGFRPSVNETAKLALADSEEAVWTSITSGARNRIRKAEKFLTANISSDPNLIEQYYDLIVRRYEEQHMAFPFKIDRLLILANTLGERGLLTLVEIRYKGKLAAAGIFPHDERCIYYFGGASDRRFNKYCPNELMHWTLMKEAIRLRIPEYDLCGTSQFKRKFGSTDVEQFAWCYSPLPGLLALRTLVYRLHWKRLRLSYSLKNAIRR